jgi:hypothetical protein
MPSIDDIYGFESRPVYRRPEVVTPPPAVPSTALARFQGGIGSALKADALQTISVPIKAVETREQATSLADVRAQVKLLLKTIEDRRKTMVEPLKREAAAVDAEARTWADPLKDWDRRAEQALLAFQRLTLDRLRRESEAKQKALTAAAEKQAEAEAAGDAQAAEAASLEIMRAEAVPEPQEIRGFKTDAGTTFLRTCWRVEVVNAEEVPPVYLVPDLKKLQAAVDAGARDIPGCHVHEVESLAVRTRG